MASGQKLTYIFKLKHRESQSLHLARNHGRKLPSPQQTWDAADRLQDLRGTALKGPRFFWLVMLFCIFAFLDQVLGMQIPKCLYRGPSKVVFFRQLYRGPLMGEQEKRGKL